MTGRGKGGKGFGPSGVPIEVISTGRIRREETEFACRFSVPQRMQNYYYNPEPSDVGFEASRPVLFISQEFEGGFSTKWQVMICLSRWEETTRWVSLYLCCSNGGFANHNPNFKMLCEFRIVDGERKVLKSMRNTTTCVFQNQIRGFSKFARFSDAVKMIQDNTLFVEAHLTLLWMSGMGDVNDNTDLKDIDLDLLNNEFDESASNGSQDLEDYSDGYWPDLPEKDKVRFFLDGVCVGWVDREKLLEISEAYQKCIGNGWEGSSTRLDFVTGDLPCFTKAIIFEYLVYVNQGSTDLLEVDIGRYKELLQLFDFANTMMTKSLMEHCIVSMSERVKVRDVPHAVMFFKEHRDLLDEASLENFRDFCVENIHEIRETDGFQKLFEQERDYLTSFILDPDFAI